MISSNPECATANTKGNINDATVTPIVIPVMYAKIFIVLSSLL